jgi:hypothetical protein
MGTQTRDLLACSIVSQPTTLPRAPNIFVRIPWKQSKKNLSGRRLQADIMYMSSRHVLRSKLNPI